MSSDERKAERTWHKLACKVCHADSKLSQRKSDGVILCPRDKAAAIEAENTEVPI